MPFQLRAAFLFNSMRQRNKNFDIIATRPISIRVVDIPLSDMISQSWPSQAHITYLIRLSVLGCYPNRHGDSKAKPLSTPRAHCLVHSLTV
jgi:hypothetical protein